MLHGCTLYYYKVSYGCVCSAPVSLYCEVLLLVFLSPVRSAFASGFAFSVPPAARKVIHMNVGQAAVTPTGRTNRAHATLSLALLSALGSRAASFSSACSTPQGTACHCVREQPRWPSHLAGQPLLMEGMREGLDLLRWLVGLLLLFGSCALLNIYVLDEKGLCSMCERCR